MPAIQTPSIIIPTTYAVGTETLTLNDTDKHVSVEFPVEFLREKIVYVVATEVVALGTPGVLHCWVEISPVLSTVSTSYWSAIGGGGGARDPVSPVLEVAAGTSLTVHTFNVVWSTHSRYARFCVRTPNAATPTTAYWLVQALFAGS